jgi:O-antigen/teichoic acid export membrane protein
LSRRTGSAFVLTFAAQIITNLQGLVVLPIVIHTAGAATYGAYILVNMTVVEVFAFLTSGIAYRYTRNLVSATSFIERRRLFEPQFSFQVTVFIVVVPCLLLANSVIDDLFGTTGLHLSSWVLVALIAANIIRSQAVNYYLYTLRLTPYNVIVGGTTVVFLAVLASFVFVTRRLSLNSLLTVQILASLCATLPFAVAMLREIGFPRLRLPFRTFVHDLRAGISVTLDRIVEFTLGSGDRYLITFYLSITDVGRYQPAYQLASVVLFLPRLVATVLSPIVSRLVDAGDRAAAERIVTTSLSLFLMVGVPFVAGTLMVGPSLILLLTNADVAEASRWVTPFVAVGMVCCGVVWIIDTVVVGLNRPKLILLADIKGAAVNLGLNIVLLAIFRSITIPAVTTLIGYAVTMVALTRSVRSLWRLHVDWPDMLRFCVAALVMIGVLWLLGFRPTEVSAVGVARFAASATAGAVVYFAVLSAIGGFGRKQWVEIRNLLASRAPDTGLGGGGEPSTGS